MGDKPTLQENLAGLKISIGEPQENTRVRGRGRGRGRERTVHTEVPAAKTKAAKGTRLLTGNKEKENTKYGALTLSRVCAPASSQSSPISQSRGNVQDKREPKSQANASPGSALTAIIDTCKDTEELPATPFTPPNPRTAAHRQTSPVGYGAVPSHRSLQAQSPAALGRLPMPITTEDTAMLMDFSPMTISPEQIAALMDYSPMTVSPQEGPMADASAPNGARLSRFAMDKAAMPAVSEASDRMPAYPTPTGLCSGPAATSSTPLDVAQGSASFSRGEGAAAEGRRRSRSRSHCLSQATKDFIDAINSGAGGNIWASGSPLLSQGRASGAPCSSGDKPTSTFEPESLPGVGKPQPEGKSSASGADGAAKASARRTALWKSQQLEGPSSHCLHAAVASYGTDNLAKAAGHVTAQALAAPIPRQALMSLEEQKAAGAEMLGSSSGTSASAVASNALPAAQSNAGLVLPLPDCAGAAAPTAAGNSAMSHNSRWLASVNRQWSVSAGPATAAPAEQGIMRTGGSKAAQLPVWVASKQPDPERLGLPYPTAGVPVSSRADAEKIHKAFAKQQEAIDYAEKCNLAAAVANPTSDVEDIVKVWCEEQKGRTAYYRTFLAASYRAFWERYQQLAVHARHCYEVIQQDKPCNLYFDLEFHRLSNPAVEGQQMVDTLVEMTADGLREAWGIELGHEDIIEMDSSTEEKFSRHLLVKLQGHAFEGNGHAGDFVRRLMASPRACQLIVRKAQADATAAQDFTSIVDTAVYTKNRHFRIIWSSKGGKAAVLMPTHRFDGARAALPLQDQFLSALVCNVAPSSRLMTLDPMKLNARGMLHAAGGRAPRQSIPEAGTAGVIGHGPVVVSRKCDADDEAAPACFSFERIQSWAEAARDFVEEVARARAGGLAASVRSITHCGTAGIVAFSMLGPGGHFCENIGRNHRSNYIFFVINFPDGVFCQKCHDPECRDFRSLWRPLPSNLCPMEAPASIVTAAL